MGAENTASDGSFTFKNLAPGEYHLAAWDDLDGNPNRPEFFKPFESSATTATVHEGSHASVSVKLITVN